MRRCLSASLQWSFRRSERRDGSHENEPDNGEKLVNILIDKGCRNIGLIGWEQGDATWLGRWTGYKAGVEKWNKAHPNDQVNLSEPQYGITYFGKSVKGYEFILMNKWHEDEGGIESEKIFLIK